MNHHHPDNGPDAYQAAIARRIHNARHAKALAAREAASTLSLSQPASTIPTTQGGAVTTTPAPKVAA